MRLRLAHELLDEDEGTPGEVEKSLRELWWINRHLGGLSSWRQLLQQFLDAPAGEPWPSPLTWLEVGAGAGELARANVAWLQARGFEVRLIGLDRRRSHLPAAAGTVSLVADARRLPLADASVDIVACNLFLHHFHDHPGRPEATALLCEMARVARRAVLVNDLRRHWLPYAAIHGLLPAFGRITRHDAPRSVAQAYTARELEALARGVPLARAQVLPLKRFRLGLILRCGEDGRR